MTFPEHADLFSIGAFRLGDKIVPTHNGMIGRYPGADGMKTGFTCPAGFNLVASATRENRKIIVVVYGQMLRRDSVPLTQRIFSTAPLHSRLGDLASDLAPVEGGPPDMRERFASGAAKRRSSKLRPKI